MSDFDFNALISKQLDKLDSKMEKMDSKMDDMAKVHERNTVVLEEHERRSTASESRISILEEKELRRAQKAAKLTGFVYYSGVTLGGIAALVYFLVNLTDLWKNVGH